VNAEDELRDLAGRMWALRDRQEKATAWNSAIETCALLCHNRAEALAAQPDNRYAEPVGRIRCETCGGIVPCQQHSDLS
jgi:hypothetical protein